MVVEEVRRKGRNVFVSFDNYEQIIVPYELFVNSYLVKGDELSSKEKEKLVEKVEIYKIKQSSYRYLSGRNHSRYELKLKLVKKSYNKSFIESVLDDLENLQLLNDKEFARNFFFQQQKRKIGLLKIKANLSKKGVSREIIESVVSELSEDEVFLKQAQLLVEKKMNLLRIKELPSIKIKQKLYQFLGSRGFTTDIISKVVNELELKD